MPIETRPYMQGGGSYGGGGVGLPRPSRVVGALLVLNVAAFVVQALVAVGARVRGTDPLAMYLGVTVADWWQVWRYVTFQFLHDIDWVWHLILNMLALYLLGTPLERMWGGRRFLVFYLACGAAAGVAYVVIGLLAGLGRHVPIIGASGGVYGVLLAAAVLMPYFRVILLVFPVPIRLAALLIFGAMVLTVLSSLGRGDAAAAMSDVAHLGGAAAAAVWIWVVPRLGLLRIRPGRPAGPGNWDKSLTRRRAEEEQVDKVLDKIRESGIGSLSWREKRILRKAARRRREEGP